MKLFEKVLLRLALNGRLPFSRQFLAWKTKRQLAATGPTSALCCELEIPDPTRPIPEDERGIVGASAHLIPFVPQVLTARDVIGRRIDEINPHLGTYGMGGPGFLGFRLENEWLVFSIWGAGEWIRVDDCLIADHFFDNHQRPRPWICEGSDALSPKLVGAEVTFLEIRKRSLDMSFSNGMSLKIDDCPDDRPVFEGTKKPRMFLESDDLRKAVFLAPTNEIWV